MMRILLMFLGGLLLLSACEGEPDPAFIQIVNGSKVDFDYVSFYGVPESQAFGALAPGDTSVYRRSPANTSFPALLLRIGPDTLSSIYTVIYFAPPPPLEPGYYTYEVGLSSGDTAGVWEYR